jgi:hypothetical protein
MDKESFIGLLKRSSPNDIREFLQKKGKRKLVNPFYYVEKLPPQRKIFSKENAIEGEFREV